jgi:intergrase/recombinase
MPVSAITIEPVWKCAVEMMRRGVKARCITYLRMNGIESELIDLLQGRIPKTVFARHYFRPDFEKDTERIQKSLDGLMKLIV